MLIKTKLVLKKVKEILVDEEIMQSLNEICRDDIENNPDEDSLDLIQRKRLIALLVKSDISTLLSQKIMTIL